MSNDPAEYAKVVTKLIEYRTKLKREQFTLSVADLLALDQEIERLERCEHELMSCPDVIEKESPEERRIRLQSWQAEEKKIATRGALKRVAAREGVTRQVISEILKREPPAK